MDEDPQRLLNHLIVKLVGKPSTKVSKISNSSPIFDRKNISGNRVKSRDLIYITKVRPGVPLEHFPRKSSFLIDYFQHLTKALPTSAIGLRDELLLCFYISQSQEYCGVWAPLLLSGRRMRAPFRCLTHPLPDVGGKKAQPRGSTHHGSHKGHCLQPQ